ncbi:MAG TPA: hypothetical protein VGE29_06460 [Prosthecobacter sp.]
MSINLELQTLYARHLDHAVKHGQGTLPLPTNPMLLCYDEQRFADSSLRVMICGQETVGWDTLGSSVETGMATYRRFFVERQFYPGYGKSAFWKAFRFFEDHLPGIVGTQKIQFLYQNISKMGRADSRTGVPDSIRQVEREHFNVVSQEMRILAPHMVLFLTGGRDGDIRFHFPDARFQQAGANPDLRKRAWVASAHLPAVSLRLYHPSYFAGWSRVLKKEYLALISEKWASLAGGGNPLIP